MEANIQKLVIDYFSHFEEFYNRVKSCFKDCFKCAIAINKLNIRTKHIKLAEIKGSPLEEFTGIQGILCSKIHSLIAEELKDIQQYLSEIEVLFEQLCSKKAVLNNTCKQTNFEETSTLVKGSPLQPPLEVLLQYSEDTIKFGSEITALSETALSALSIKGENTEAFKDNFEIPAQWQRKASEIIAYTSFCSHNQL